MADDDDDGEPEIWDTEMIRHALWLDDLEEWVPQLYQLPYSAILVKRAKHGGGLVAPGWLHDEFVIARTKRPDEDTMVRLGTWLIEARSVAIACNAMAVSGKAGEHRPFTPKGIIDLFGKVPVLEARGPTAWLNIMGFMIKARLVKRSWKGKKPIFRLTPDGHALATFDSQQLVEHPDWDFNQLTDDLRKDRLDSEQELRDAYYQSLADKRREAEGS